MKKYLSNPLAGLYTARVPIHRISEIRNHMKTGKVVLTNTVVEFVGRLVQSGV